MDPVRCPECGANVTPERIATSRPFSSLLLTLTRHIENVLVTLLLHIKLVLVTILLVFVFVGVVAERRWCPLCGQSERRAYVAICLPIDGTPLLRTPCWTKGHDDGSLPDLLDPTQTCRHQWRVGWRDEWPTLLQPEFNPAPYPTVHHFTTNRAFRDYLINDRPEALAIVRQFLQRANYAGISSLMNEEYEFWQAGGRGRPISSKWPEIRDWAAGTPGS